MTSNDQSIGALKRELARIGRYERSIQPSALEQYSALLDTAATRRLAPANPTLADLKQAAHDAILEAIAGLPTPVHRAIGEALLAASSEFQGKLVKERTEALHRPPLYITKESYKDERDHVLTLIARYLADPPPQRKASDDDAKVVRKLVRAADVDAVDALNELAGDAGVLWSVCDAYAYVRDLSRRIESGETSFDYTRRFPAGLNVSLGNALIAFLLSSEYCFSRQGYSLRPAIERYLPAESVTFLSWLVQRSHDASPVDTARLFRYAFVVGARYPFWQRHLKEITDTIHAWPHWRTRFEKDLAELIANCCELATHLTDYVEVAPLRGARSLTLELVANYYGVNGDTAYVTRNATSPTAPVRMKLRDDIRFYAAINGSLPVIDNSVIIRG